MRSGGPDGASSLTGTSRSGKSAGPAGPPRPSRRRGRPPGSTGDATRGRLLVAARTLFAERGYDATAVVDLVAAAGVTTPVLYHHFSSKAGMYAAVATEVYDVVISAFADAISEVDGFAERFERVLATAKALHVRDPSVAGFIVAAPVTISAHPELQHVGSQLSRTGTFCERLVSTSRPLPLGMEPSILARALQVQLWGLTRFAATLPDPDTLDGTFDAVRQLVVGSLETARGSNPAARSSDE